MLVGERADFLAVDDDSPDQIAVLAHGHEHKAPNTRKLNPGYRPCFAVEICLIRREIDDMDYLLGLDHAAEEAGGPQGGALALLDQNRRCIVRGSEAEHLPVAQVHVSELGLADAYRVLQHDLEHRLQLPW